MSCKINPEVRNKEGQLVESELYKQLYSLTKDRELTNLIYSMVHDPMTKSMFYNEELDVNGEPTLESLNKVMNLQEVIEDKAKVELLNKQLSNNKAFDTLDEILPKVLKFNKENPEYVATIYKKDGQYRVVVSVKNNTNELEGNKLEASNTLNQQLIQLLSNIGVGVDTNYQSSVAHGVFDPTNAYTTAEGLKVLIRIANNELGQEALPEEVAHFVVEALGNEPLVRRLLTLLTKDGVVEEILGDSFNTYNSLYKGDQTKLVKEAAGKLLAQHLKNENNLIVKQNKSLLQRIWDKIKSVFTKVKVSDVNTAIMHANEILKDISTGVKQGALISMLDIDLASKGQTLYFTDKTIEQLKKTANMAMENKLKAVQIYQNRKKGKAFSAVEAKKLEQLKKDIEDGRYIKGITDFLEDARNMVVQSQDSISKLYETGELNVGGTVSEQRKVAKLLRDIKNFVASYRDPLEEIVGLEVAVQRGELDIDIEDARKLTTIAREINGVIKSLDGDYKKVSFALIYNMLKPIFGEDKVVPFGKNKGEIITLDDLLKGVHKDINFINQFLDSAADSGDIAIALFDKVIKIAKHNTRMQVEELTHEMRKIHNVLLNSGEKNTEFMFEMDENGVPTGYFVSDIDHGKYNRAKAAKRQELVEAGMEEDIISSEMAKWERINTTPILVDDMNNRWERMPKKSLYPSNKLSSLNSAQMKYYNDFMKIKSVLDTLIPESAVYKYKAIQDRNETLEAIKDTPGLKNKAKAYGSSLADRVLRREDDDEYGNTLEDTDENGVTKVLVDFNGQEVRRLPIYYTNMLKDMSRLSLDASSSIIKYGAMAMNYHSMFQIVDTLELGRDLMRQRKIQQHKGSRKLIEKINALGQSLQKDYEKGGEDSNIVRRYDDLLDMQVYGRMKLDEGTWNVMGKEVDKAKVADAVAHVTSLSTLGFNFFSGINNVTVGKFQLMIEAVAGEYFGYKDTLVAEKNYFAGLPALTAEIGSNMVTSKLGLITETFDVFQDWDSEAKSNDFYKSTTERIFGKGSVYFLQSAGEHYMQSKTLLSYMSAYKVKDATGKEISLYDAYEVSKEIVDGKVVDAKLKLKDGVTKLDGSAFTEEDVMEITHKVAKINQGMHGIYNNADKSAIQKYALGRLAIMFRKWMVPHYNRRFKGTYYDVQLDQWREGFHGTMGKFIVQLAKELKQGQLNIATSWKALSNHEKANIKRSLTEVISFLALSLALFLMGSWKDKDTWAGRVAQYQLRRLHLELGTSFYVPMMVTEGMTILQSPSAAMKTTNLAIETLNLFDLSDEITAGKYKGHSVYYRNAMQNMPVLGNVRKVFDIQTDDAMFNIFK